MAFFSPHHLIQLLHTYGYAVLSGVIGLESLGVPLPGETLLIAAAVLAATTPQLNIVLVVMFAALGATVGQMAAYWIGSLISLRLLRRYGRYIGLTDRRLAFGRVLFRRHGMKVMIVSRFIVLLRTVAALLAGLNRMPWPRFILANVVGSVAWSALYGFGAYTLGHEARHMARPVAIAIVITAAAVLLAVGIYVRRRERALFHTKAKMNSNGETDSVTV